MDLSEVPTEGLGARHPWEVARLAFFLRTLAARGLPGPSARVLDVGAGDAWLAGRLAEACGARVVCWDSAYDDRPPRPASPSVSFTARAPEGAFDLVLALDVAEHVEDDRGFVQRLAGHLLRPGGHLLFSVPAWPRLFSGHDRMLRHVRRYTPRGARSLLESAGVEVVQAGGLFHALLLPRALQVAWERGGGAAPAPAGAWRGSALATRAIAAALAADTRVSGAFARIGWDVPGLSWWALCRKT